MMGRVLCPKDWIWFDLGHIFLKLMISRHFHVAVSRGGFPVPHNRLGIQPELSMSLDETQSCPTVHHFTANVGFLEFHRGETLNCTTMLHLTAPESTPRYPQVCGCNQEMHTNLMAPRYADTA